MSDEPQVIRVSGSDLEELAELFRTAAAAADWVRVMVQDGGVKVAYGRGAWSLPLGEDVTPRQVEAPTQLTGAELVAHYLATYPGEF